jgi:hypothetical protein
VSISYLTAVRSSDAENTRRRTGTLPTGYDRHHKRRFGFHGGVLVLAMAAGVVVGVML